MSVGHGGAREPAARSERRVGAHGRCCTPDSPSAAAFPIGELAESGNGRKATLTLAQIDPVKVEAVQPLRAYNKQRAGMSGTVLREGIDSKYAAAIKAVARYWMPRAVRFGCA